MPIGPGKYDDEATRVRESTGAQAVLVAVIDGVLGTGFSVQAPLHIAQRLPRVLRDIANEIEAVQKLRGPLG
jgi:hypothetical protein